MIRALLLLWALPLGCAPPDDPAPLADPAPLLTRASLDLRGRRPSPAELAEARAHPGGVDATLSTWLNGPELGPRIQAMWGPIWLTQADEYLVSARAFGEEDEAAFYRSMGEQPLRVLAHVATEDMPWSEIVTADWTLADALLERVLPVERLSDEPGWQLARYTDHRPPLGAFGSPGIYLRYTSTEFNAQRGRANAMTRILLCDDYLARPIALDRGTDLLDQEAAIDAIRTDPGCVACHSTLDPISGNLWGFHQMLDAAPREYAWYHPERESFWEIWSGVPPGFEGQPTEGAHELGPLLVANPGFDACAVQQARTVMLQDEELALDPDGLAATREVYDLGGGRMKAALAGLLWDPSWRGVGLESAGKAGRKLISADLLESSLSALVGVQLRLEGWGLTDNDRLGLRTLAGGVDGRFQTAVTTQPTPTLVLVQARLAEIVAGLATGPDSMGSLFEDGDLDADLSEAAWKARHADLSRSVLSRDPHADEITADRALYDAARQAGASPAEAWQVLLTAMLRDPAVLWD